ncbi:hypothetical protein E4U09_007853 [Claviceps aff. purpurea]|uniref:ARID domain-containing protein n=1 Tax=Claviceps aff. purpurea TaxID=1967640 RepID=A0A9P7TY06_9HYPO|nr:hypothetical protein E4U09_007853 [Claviceps aff. purpurea]
MEFIMNPQASQEEAAAQGGSAALTNFTYLQQHQLVICREHGYAVGLNLKRHVKQHHPRYTRSVQQAVLLRFQSLPRTAPDKAVLPPAYGPPIEGLLPPQRAFKCIEAECGHISISRDGIMAHCRLAHNWKHTKDSPTHWTELFVQSFSRTPGRQRWFAVSVEEGHTTAVAAPASADIMAEIEKIKSEAAVFRAKEKAKITTHSTPKSLPQTQSTISHDSATRGQPNLILLPVDQKTQESRTRTRTSFTPAACPSSPQRKSSMSASATENPRQPSASHESTPAQSKEHETKIEDKENRDRFEYEIRIFVKETRRSVSLYPEVEGQTFHLYKLARAVVTQKVANEQVDWRRVAEDLGYDLKQNQGVANGLKKCFEKTLAVFFEASRILQAKLHERGCSPAQSEEDGNESEADDEDHFYQDLEDFQDRSGLPVKRESEVGGKRLEFWHLGHAVLAHRESNGEVDWWSVAGDLEAKYDWRQDQEVVDELKDCFKEHLAAFFEEVLDDLEKEEAAHEHEEDEFQSNLDSPERQLYPSSPPVRPSGHKRPLDDDDPVYVPEKSAKRRRLDRTAEIPSPPAEMLGIPSSCTPTGSKFRQQKQDEEENEEDIEEIYGYAPPVMSSSDLGSPPGTSHGDFGDVAPSPEPNFQALNVEPIPLNLAPSRSVGRPQQSDHAEPLQQRQAASDANKTSGINRRSLSSSFYKRPSQDSPAQGAGKTSQQPSQPESPDRRASSSEPTLLECIENYEAQGYSRDIVMDALGRTSRRPGPNAERLMELLSKNEEVPHEMRGVWTDRDDMGLRWADCVRAGGLGATESQKTSAKKELEWLVHKHTEEETDLRRRYFERLTREMA